MDIKIPENIKIIFFDMDHTLINNDCDVSWKAYLRAKGLASFGEYLESKWHYAMYRLGRLNERRFIRFQLRQFQQKTASEMDPLLVEHFEQYVRPTIYKQVLPLIESLREKKIKCILLTATNEEIARPLVDFLKMDGLLATRLHKSNHRYTGEMDGEVCLGVKKFLCLSEYLKQQEIPISEASYWGDSVSDLAVLAKVGFPVAANPVSSLRKFALENGWTVVDFTQ